MVTAAARANRSSQGILPEGSQRVPPALAAASSLRRVAAFTERVPRGEPRLPSARHLGGGPPRRGVQVAKARPERWPGRGGEGCAPRPPTWRAGGRSHRARGRRRGAGPAPLADLRAAPRGRPSTRACGADLLVAVVARADLLKGIWRRLPRWSSAALRATRSIQAAKGPSRRSYLAIALISFANTFWVMSSARGGRRQCTGHGPPGHRRSGQRRK
jgi:hypothetical protein